MLLSGTLSRLITSYLRQRHDPPKILQAKVQRAVNVLQEN